ncbi:hypothetical protein WCT67_19805, partial [Pectobacterium parvum]|uniref:hypothetical protein n=1 Tax=Pectobacterium parvum TaxID=2778550 RepID=UPI00301AB93E
SEYGVEWLHTDAAYSTHNLILLITSAKDGGVTIDHRMKRSYPAYPNMIFLFHQKEFEQALSLQLFISLIKTTFLFIYSPIKSLKKIAVLSNFSCIKNKYPRRTSFTIE